jgi:hypothetical protein
VVAGVAATLYRDQASPPVALLEFSDGAFDVLFDAAHELTILMHGLSQSTLPNSRDRNYHRGFPGRAGFDKGHAMSHAQGGREGGPNYFLQAPRVNRRCPRWERCGAILSHTSLQTPACSASCAWLIRARPRPTCLPRLSTGLWQTGNFAP